jgi:hypothetical protein
MVVNPWRSAQEMGVPKAEVGELRVYGHGGDLMRVDSWEHSLQVGFRHG